MDIELLIKIIVGGALGGLVSGFINPSGLKIMLTGGKVIPLGFIGDLCVGIAAGISVFFVLGPVFSIDLNSSSETGEHLKVIALSVISGFSGIPLLKKFSINLLGKVDRLEDELKEIKTHEKAKEYLEQGIHLFDNGDYEGAIKLYDIALTVRPRYSQAMCRKAMSLKRLNRVEGAFNLMEELLKINPEDPSGWYNKACYRAVLGHNKELVISDLAKATDKNEWFKILARSDSDFDKIRNEEKFKEIIA